MNIHTKLESQPITESISYSGESAKVALEYSIFLTAIRRTALVKKLRKKPQNATTSDVLIAPPALDIALPSASAIYPLGYVLRCLLTTALISFPSVVLLHRDRGNKSI